MLQVNFRRSCLQFALRYGEGDPAHPQPKGFTLDAQRHTPPQRERSHHPKPAEGSLSTRQRFNTPKVRFDAKNPPQRWRSNSHCATAKVHSGKTPGLRSEIHMNNVPRELPREPAQPKSVAQKEHPDLPRPLTLTVRTSSCRHTAWGKTA